ncbi:hypothetical protein [Methylobacterium sp. CM6244]
MLPSPHITDHALLRWMERVHGVDIESWRRLMLDDLRDALDAHDGRHIPGRAAFILSPTGENVVTVIGAGQALNPYQAKAIAVARAVA